MFSKASSSTDALTIYLPPTIYVAGSDVSGELELHYRHLQDENIEDVQLRLRGSSKTWIHRDKLNLKEVITLAHDDLSLWSRGGAYPSPGSDVLRIPFSVRLPDHLPPSFHYFRFDQNGSVRYSLSAVGTRKGILNRNKRVRLPLAVLPRDALGAELKIDPTARGWKTHSKHDKIRKGLWGDYATVRVELSLPNIPVVPLFTDIPYSLTVVTTTAPQPRSELLAPPPAKPVFPAVPRSPADLEFTLHRHIRLRAQILRASASGTVTTFLGWKKPEDAPKAPVDVDVAGIEWVPEGTTVPDKLEKEKEKPPPPAPGTKGAWVQRAQFRSTLRLTCPPTFAVHNIECDYKLVLKVPFAGIGNDLKLDVPVKVTSGTVQSLPRDEGGEPGAVPDLALDLPPAYWDTSDQGWADDEKD